MAIKLFDVQGDRLLNLAGVENKTQDIIMISNPFFFTANPNTYVPLLKTLSGGGAQLIEWVFSIFPPQVSVLLKAGLLGFQGTTVTNPLEAPYYSTTPYRIGASGRGAYKYDFRLTALLISLDSASSLVQMKPRNLSTLKTQITWQLLYKTIWKKVMLASISMHNLKLMLA